MAPHPARRRTPEHRGQPSRRRKPVRARRAGRLFALLVPGTLRRPLAQTAQLVRSSRDYRFLLAGGAITWALPQAVHLGEPVRVLARVLLTLLVAGWYFWRRGELAAGRADLRRLRQVLAAPMPEGGHRERLLRAVLARALWVRRPTEGR
jgi:hypothetical protein